MIKSGSLCSVLSKVWRGIMGCVVFNQKVTSYFQSLSLFLSRKVCFYASFSIADCWFFFVLLIRLIRSYDSPLLLSHAYRFSLSCYELCWFNCSVVFKTLF